MDEEQLDSPPGPILDRQEHELDVEGASDGLTKKRRNLEFEGNDVGLFAQGGEYDDDDKEADLVWDYSDKHLDSRRKDRREAHLKRENEYFRASKPKITEQFSDLKRKLVTLSASDWESIPERGVYVDFVPKEKKHRFVNRFPSPDECPLKRRALQNQEYDFVLDSPSGTILRHFLGSSGVETEFAAIVEGRSRSVSVNLDRLSDSVRGMIVVAPEGYLTNLMNTKINSGAEISDIKKARLLLKSLTQTNPKNQSGWVAAARLEEVVADIKTARNFIQRGCKECPKKEDVWLEACRGS